MMGDMNVKSENDIPAAHSTSLTASISARARKMYQQSIIRS
jgi:hypothetical protein